MFFGAQRVVINGRRNKPFGTSRNNNLIFTEYSINYWRIRNWRKVYFRLDFRIEEVHLANLDSDHSTYLEVCLSIMTSFTLLNVDMFSPSF